MSYTYPKIKFLKPIDKSETVCYNGGTIKKEAHIMWSMNEDEYIAKFCGGSRERFENKIACKMLKLYDRSKDDDGTARIVYADYANQTYVAVIGRK